VTPDLWLARVFIRLLDEGAAVEDTLKGLDAAGSFIRRELGKVLRVRRIPDLRFVHDTTFDLALRIEEVLKEVLPEGAPEAVDGRSASEKQEGAIEERGGEE
jgi:ribosome-binding factor A